MKFAYSVTTKKGKIQKGIMEADSAEEAEKALLEKDYIIISVEPQKRKRTTLGVPIIGGISTLDKIFFTKHLSALIKAGLPLKESIAAIREQTTSANFKIILDRLIDNINQGESLSASFAHHSKHFDQLFVNIIRVGEKSGTLEKNLNYLSVQLEKDYNLKRKFIAAMIYPIIIFVLAILVGAGMIIFILPRLLPVFKSLDIELPITTKILIFISEFFQDYGLFVVIGIVAVFIFLRILMTIPSMKYAVSRIILAFPVTGALSKNLNLALFSRTMGTLLRSGIPVIEAVDITILTMGNTVYKGRLGRVKTGIQQGETIGNILDKEKKLFPVTMSRMIAVGEKSGTLDDTLKYLAEFYEKEIDNQTTNLSSVLHPILMITVGLIVGFIAISIITPIYKFTESIKR